MDVLNIVTDAHSRFFEQQVDVLRRRGLETTVLDVPGTRTQTDDETTSRSPLDYLRFYPAVLSESFGSYDLLHANYGLTGPAALAQPNLPVVLSLWGSDLMGRYGPISRVCARWVDEVVVMSDEMAAMLDTDCHVIPHGVNLDRFQPGPQAAARDRVGWRDDCKHVLFPYPAQRTVKNYPRAERIVDAARDRYDGAVELHTLHSVPHRRMPDYMNAADVLLLTSRREGSPNSVKEALACNLPVVATDVGDVGQRLAGVDLSFVCGSDAELTEALVSVCRADARSDGRDRAREISLDRMAERLEALYESVADSGRVTPRDAAAVPR